MFHASQEKTPYDHHKRYPVYFRIRSGEQEVGLDLKFDLHRIECRLFSQCIQIKIVNRRHTHHRAPDVLPGDTRSS